MARGLRQQKYPEHVVLVDDLPRVPSGKVKKDVLRITRARNSRGTNRMTEALIRYEEPAPHVARIVLARAEKHNAINPQMIFEVNDAFTRALYDDQ